MDRVEFCRKKYEELFGQVPVGGDDPEFMAILQRFVFGEVFQEDTLTDELRELITIVVLTVNQTLPQLKAHAGTALRIGIQPVKIKEAVYQCAPYIGFPKTLNGIAQVNAVLQEAGVSLPLPPQGTVTEENRLSEGLATQKAIFGDTIDVMRAKAPADEKQLQDDLSALCFGDFYTRGGLDIPTRELLTFCMLIAHGGCENQVKGHIQGNLRVGNGRNILLAAIRQCLLYIGFPRTLNALACLDEICPAGLISC